MAAWQSRLVQKTPIVFVSRAPGHVSQSYLTILKSKMADGCCLQKSEICNISAPSMHIYKCLLFARRDIYDGEKQVDVLYR